jgi:MFS family permease
LLQYFFLNTLPGVSAGLSLTKMKKKVITRTIFLLSLVSLFTDIASEMLYPVIPVYLKSIGFSVLLIGILEGIAEAVSGLSKGYFGSLSDRLKRRVPFVRYGYALSAISKPMMAVFTYPWWIFIARTADRLGKGIRTGARDAMLSDEATPGTKGQVFGFHRSLDTLGAVLGPLCALGFLLFWPEKYRALFFIAFLPGLIAIIFTLLLSEKISIGHRKINGKLQDAFLANEKKKATVMESPKVSFFDFISYWKRSPVLYRKLLTGLLLFALFNSSDMFLLIRLKESGLSDTFVIGMYIFYNLVYALFSYPVGIIADKIGLKRVFIIGLLMFTAVYLGMGLNTSLSGFVILFFLYGIYAAATEGISKAWITNIAAKADTATAIGTYTAFQSICTMIASMLAGYIWYQYGAVATFTLSAIFTILVAIYLSGVNFIPKMAE